VLCFVNRCSETLVSIESSIEPSLTMASIGEKVAISTASPVLSRGKKKTSPMPTVEDDDERLLNQIGYTQVWEFEHLP